MFFKEVASVCVPADAHRTGAAALALLRGAIEAHLPSPAPPLCPFIHLAGVSSPDAASA